MGDLTIYYCAVIALVVVIHLALTKTRRGPLVSWSAATTNGATLVGIASDQDFGYVLCSVFAAVGPDPFLQSHRIRDAYVR